jgi:flagellar hook assembly protein FlgD
MVDGYLSAVSSYTLTVAGGLANDIIPMQKAFEGKPSLVTALMPVAPNPFRLKTSVHFTLAEQGPVNLSVYDASGRLIAHLADGPFEAGAHSVSWEGRDAKGNPVATGIYFYRMTAPGYSQTRKMVMIP